jgi:hypothetical protein
MGRGEEVVDSNEKMRATTRKGCDGKLLATGNTPVVRKGGDDEIRGLANSVLVIHIPAVRLRVQVLLLTGILVITAFV